jgi:hypothetical protein
MEPPRFPDETFDADRPRYSHRRMMQEIARAKGQIAPDGGRAFPNPYIEADPLEQGMSLRDFFAAHALMRLEGWGREADAMAKAECAYATADAMLAVRTRLNFA